MKVNGTPYQTVWIEGAEVCMIDQTLLPHRFEVVRLPDHRATAAAIRTMIVRGAPAIGASAAYGMVQAALQAPAGVEARRAHVEAAHETLRSSRPTAQDLFHALDAMMAVFDSAEEGNEAGAMLAAAEAYAAANAEECRMIGEHGAALISDGARVLTHCNAGWLATVDWGTALAPVYAAHRAGRRVHVFADETRPRGQGMNLTAWELMQEGVSCEIVADNAAGLLMRRGEVDLVITGADRIAANGDAANKIGTYEKALLAHDNGIPFYIAAPFSTFDPDCATGDDIPIEERGADEVLTITGRLEEGGLATVRIGPEGARVRNPAFDVTPARLIRGFVTPEGVIPPGRTPY